MLFLSMAIAAVGAVLGHVGAITVPTWVGFRDTSTAGMMAVSVGAIFLLTFLFSPRYGILGRFAAQAMLSLKITRDDIMGFLFRHQELAPAGAPPVGGDDLKRALKLGVSVKIALWDLARRKWVRRSAAGYALSESGRRQGQNLVRSHRLWESYLCESMGYCQTDVHRSAHRLEHFTGPEMQNRLGEQTGNPSKDPHDRVIP
jgi:hypothetical protein